MKRGLLFSLSCCLAFAAQAQVKFKITGVPANTPANAVLYMAGSFNNWSPGSSAQALTKNADGSYELTLPAGTGAVEYKFTRGSWSSVEVDAQNQDLANRTYTVDNTPATVTLQVANWKDLAGGGCQSTATKPNVQVISTSFAIPQLNRTRRVWIYVPNDYATSTRRYPVLYMHDGQNVFDACTSFSGEWGVDETLRQLQQQGLDASGSIVVAIDNDGAQRLNEYSPWYNPKYGGGQGDKYVDFLVQTLKPYIDNNYRTLSGREFTGIAGSSMGGLISTYAALKYPNVFSKVGVFSPAFWFAEKPMLEYVQQHPANPDTRFYFVAGATESETMVPLMQVMRDALQVGGVAEDNLSFNTRTDGQHAEWFWKREFTVAYQWLFAPATPTIVNGLPQLPLAFSAYPNPAKSSLTVQLPATAKEARLEVIDSAGRILLKVRARSGQVVDLAIVPKGSYILRMTAGKYVGTQWLQKE